MSSSAQPVPPGKQRVAVTLPPGVQPGMPLLVEHNGQKFQFTVPTGVQPGGQFQVEVPIMAAQQPARPPLYNRGAPPQQYGASPQQQFGAPPQQQQYGGAPPPQYQPQPASHYQYGQQHGPPPQQYGMPPQYGAPPPQQYGAPPPQYGAPPPQQYGAPPQQQQYGAPPPQQYGAPPPQATARPISNAGLPPPALGSWTCASCTYANAASASSCEMCGMRKGGSMYSGGPLGGSCEALGVSSGCAAPPPPAYHAPTPHEDEVPMGSSVPMGLPVGAAAPPPAPAQRPPPPEAPAVQSVALQHAECPICFEPLCRGELGVFLDASGQRVSRHFYNLGAARELLASGNTTCPLTRKPIASVRRVPDIRSDPDAWFGTVDVDGDGQLSHAEVVEALKATLPVDPYAFDRAAAEPGWWAQYDQDGSGYIEKHELPGLAASVRAQMPGRRASSVAIPEIRTDRQAWFSYWDEDESGSLDKEEVVRALLKTLRCTSDPARVAQMRSTVDAIWCLFDDDGNGTIERAEFLKSGDGLADTIIATMGDQQV